MLKVKSQGNRIVFGNSLLIADWMSPRILKQKY